MIKENRILELELLRQNETRANKHAKELHAQRVGLEAELIAAVEANQRIEGTRYKLSVDTFTKPFIPPYKTCAIELSSEQAVFDWVEKHNPEEEGKKLVVEVRPQRKAA